MKTALQKSYLLVGVVGVIALMFGLYAFMEARFIEMKMSNNAGTSTASENALGAFIPVAEASSPSGKPNPQCLDNYLSWPSSTIFKSDSPWSTAFVPATDMPTGSNYVMNNFERDLNGDGLADYMLVKHSNHSNGIHTVDCVALSNGSGWEVVYRCFVDVTVSPAKFYGDCAG